MSPLDEPLGPVAGPVASPVAMPSVTPLNGIARQGAPPRPPSSPSPLLQEARL